MSASLNLALVEDNALLREELFSFLVRQGWTVHEADSGEQLNQLLLKQAIELVVLDVNLPHEDGYSIAARLRQSHPRIGIIMLTARTRPSDRIMGYKTGADVFLTKPTHTEELEAAIRNLAQRLKPAPSGELTLDQQSRRLIAGPMHSCSLSLLETSLLKTMAMQANGEAEIEWLLNILSRDLGEEVSRNNLTVAISRLRSKVEVMDPSISLISSIRKVGYRLDQPIVLV